MSLGVVPAPLPVTDAVVVVVVRAVGVGARVAVAALQAVVVVVDGALPRGESVAEVGAVVLFHLLVQQLRLPR